jgi:shikimate 5-dehydrogenase
MNRYSDARIGVCVSIAQVRAFLADHANGRVCLYLADKDTGSWERSTSRVYMNQVSPALIYLPVNVTKSDRDSLKDLYALAGSSERIVAINQTQPHKSNPVLKEWLQDDSIGSVDALVKDERGRLVPYDLNGPSFVGWFKDEIGGFEDTCIVLLGVGGVGEPIARRVILDTPSKLVLVDIISKEGLRAELSAYGVVEYASDLHGIDPSGAQVVFINAAGKEGADETGAEELLERFSGQNNVFVDLRPQLSIGIVERARALGWRAYSGYGMNARNDYALLLKICAVIGEDLMPFDEFERLVARAS